MMKTAATVIDIFTSPTTGGKMIRHAQIQALAGKGLVGDRYYRDNDCPNPAAITIQSIEAIKECCRVLQRDFSAADFRRNIIVTGIELNSLVGKEFSIGNVRLRGFELCHPCRELGSRLEADLFLGLKNRGGLRAFIISSGTISIADSVSETTEISQ
jgi:MOSC domain-containing protein YiiM